MTEFYKNSLMVTFWLQGWVKPTFKGILSGMRQFLTTEIVLKMMKVLFISP